MAVEKISAISRHFPPFPAIFHRRDASCDKLRVSGTVIYPRPDLSSSCDKLRMSGGEICFLRYFGGFWWILTHFGKIFHLRDSGPDTL